METNHIYMDDDNVIHITTFEQAKIHLDKDNVICFMMSNGIGYIRKIGENKIETILQPTVGGGRVYTSTLEQFEKYFNFSISIDIPHVVIEGFELGSSKISVFARIVDFFRDIYYKIRGLE